MQLAPFAGWRTLLGVLILTAAWLAVPATAPAAPEQSDPAGAQVTHASLSSVWNGQQVECVETRVVTDSQTREAFHCTGAASPGERAAVLDPSNAVWVSDFTGQRSYDFQVTWTPSGQLSGWALY